MQLSGILTVQALLVFSCFNDVRIISPKGHFLAFVCLATFRWSIQLGIVPITGSISFSCLSFSSFYSYQLTAVTFLACNIITSLSFHIITRILSGYPLGQLYRRLPCTKAAFSITSLSFHIITRILSGYPLGQLYRRLPCTKAAFSM